MSTNAKMHNKKFRGRGEIMNLPYTNTHYRRFLCRYIKRPNEFAEKHHYNARNFRRWLRGPSFPRPPMIALLCEQISRFYGYKLEVVNRDCMAALREDYQDFLKTSL